jgi:hypothetical protein
LLLFRAEVHDSERLSPAAQAVEKAAVVQPLPIAFGVNERLLRNNPNCGRPAGGQCLPELLPKEGSSRRPSSATGFVVPRLGGPAVVLLVSSTPSAVFDGADEGEPSEFAARTLSGGFQDGHRCAPEQSALRVEVDCNEESENDRQDCDESSWLGWEPGPTDRRGDQKCGGTDEKKAVV